MRAFRFGNTGRARGSHNGVSSPNTKGAVSYPADSQTSVGTTPQFRAYSQSDSHAESEPKSEAVAQDPLGSACGPSSKAPCCGKEGDGPVHHSVVEEDGPKDRQSEDERAAHCESSSMATTTHNTCTSETAATLPQASDSIGSGLVEVCHSSASLQDFREMEEYASEGEAVLSRADSTDSLLLDVISRSQADMRTEHYLRHPLDGDEDDALLQAAIAMSCAMRDTERENAEMLNEALLYSLIADVTPQFHVHRATDVPSEIVEQNPTWGSESFVEMARPENVGSGDFVPTYDVAEESQMLLDKPMTLAAVGRCNDARSSWTMSDKREEVEEHNGTPNVPFLPADERVSIDSPLGTEFMSLAEKLPPIGGNGMGRINSEMSVEYVSHSHSNAGPVVEQSMPSLHVAQPCGDNVSNPSEVPTTSVQSVSAFAVGDGFNQLALDGGVRKQTDNSPDSTDRGADIDLSSTREDAAGEDEEIASFSAVPLQWVYAICISSELVENNLRQWELYTREGGRKFVTSLWQVEDDVLNNYRLVQFRKLPHQEHYEVTNRKKLANSFCLAVSIQSDRLLTVSCIGLVAHSNLAKEGSSDAELLVWCDMIGLISVSHEEWSAFFSQGLVSRRPPNPLKLIQLTLNCVHSSDPNVKITESSWQLKSIGRVTGIPERVAFNKRHYPREPKRVDDLKLDRCVKNRRLMFNSKSCPDRIIWCDVDQYLTKTTDNVGTLSGLVVPVFSGPDSGTWRALVVGSLQMVNSATHNRLLNFSCVALSPVSEKDKSVREEVKRVAEEYSLKEPVHAHREW